VGHVFSTRRADGDTRFDLGDADCDEPEVLERRRRLCRAAGLPGSLPQVLRQVHGATITGPDPARELAPPADAAIALRGGSGVPAPAVRTADCVPILLADVEGCAVAAVHAGWRGTEQGVARACVARLEQAGIEPARLRAAIGPAAGPCCYEVGRDVLERVAAACGAPPRELGRPGRRAASVHLDLARANELQLRGAGLPAAGIERCGLCTICSAELFFSYRREGAASGRGMALIGWVAAGAP